MWHITGQKLRNKSEWHHTQEFFLITWLTCWNLLFFQNGNIKVTIINLVVAVVN